LKGGVEKYKVTSVVSQVEQVIVQTNMFGLPRTGESFTKISEFVLRK